MLIGVQWVTGRDPAENPTDNYMAQMKTNDDYMAQHCHCLGIPG